MKTVNKPETEKRGARRRSGRLCTFYLSNDSDESVNALAGNAGSRSKAVSLAVAVSHALLRAGQLDFKTDEIPNFRVEVITNEIQKDASPAPSGIKAILGNEPSAIARSDASNAIGTRKTPAE